MPIHCLRLQPCPLPLRHPPPAWRTAVAGPSSVTLCGPAGSETWAELLWTCISVGRAGFLKGRRRRAVRWPQQSAALHCSRHQEGLVQKPQLHQDLRKRREQRGQGWGTLSLGWRGAGSRRVWLILALKYGNSHRCDTLEKETKQERICDQWKQS